MRRIKAFFGKPKDVIAPSNERSMVDDVFDFCLDGLF